MVHRYHEIAFTPAVKAEQEARGSRASYARFEPGPVRGDRLTGAEAAFIAERDSFYMASVTETGWPYLQHRGGPAGFLRVLDDRTLGFADYRGNRQYVTLGALGGEDRVSLFLMDYPNQRRLKLFGRARATEEAQTLRRLADPAYDAVVERAMLITVEAYDWNCPQHITPRFTQAEITEAVAPLFARIKALEAETEALRARLAERP